MQGVIHHLNKLSASSLSVVGFSASTIVQTENMLDSQQAAFGKDVCLVFFICPRAVAVSTNRGKIFLENRSSFDNSQDYAR